MKYIVIQMNLWYTEEKRCDRQNSRKQTQDFPALTVYMSERPDERRREQ